MARRNPGGARFLVSLDPAYSVTRWPRSACSVIAGPLPMLGWPTLRWSLRSTRCSSSSRTPTLSTSSS